MIFTIGHSTRPEKEFIELLKQYSIQTLVDVRTLPRSRWNPQFNMTSMQKSLPAAGIEYVHEPKLGGLREPSPGSINTGWKTPGFRGYADYMQTREFENAILKIIQLSSNRKIALMCAEKDYTKCHRQLLSDALTARSLEVLHIIDPTQTKLHERTSFAKVNGSNITYPENQSKLEF